MASAFGSASALHCAEGKEDPVIVSVEVNNGCNLSCTGCYIAPEFGYENKEASLPILLEKLHSVIHNLSLERRDIILACAGKEPLFDQQRLHAAYATIAGNKNIVGVTAVTNGNKRLVQQNMPLLRELYGIDVSLNGGTEEDNAKTRGKGSFESALEGILALQCEGIDVGISYLIMQENKEYIDSFSKAVEASRVKRVSYSIARTADGRLQFGEQEATNVLARAIEQTPRGVIILVETPERADMQGLARKLRGEYSETRESTYALPQIIGTQWEIKAPTYDTAPQHIRLRADGMSIPGKGIFDQKQTTSAPAQPTYH